jgi:hypothetical protein
MWYVDHDVHVDVDIAVLVHFVIVEHDQHDTAVVPERPRLQSVRGQLALLLDLQVQRRAVPTDVLPRLDAGHQEMQGAVLSTGACGH